VDVGGGGQLASRMRRSCESHGEHGEPHAARAAARRVVGALWAAHQVEDSVQHATRSARRSLPYKTAPRDGESRSEV